MDRDLQGLLDLLAGAEGATVTGEGIPIGGDGFDGNETDQIWNQKLLDWLDGWIAPGQREQTLLCADSALVTTGNLSLLDDHQFKFASRLPNSFGWSDVARAEALHGPEDRWEDVGQLSPGKGKASYRLRETTGEIDGRVYRMIVIHSSSLAERKAHSFAHRTEKEREAVQRAGKKLLGQVFSCREDAGAAIEQALADLRLQFWETEQRVEAELLEPPRRRGRPKKTEPPSAGTLVYRAHLGLGARLDAEIERQTRWHSTFILITNDQQCTPKELFLAYRAKPTSRPRSAGSRAPSASRQSSSKSPSGWRPSATSC